MRKASCARERHNHSTAGRRLQGAVYSTRCAADGRRNLNELSTANIVACSQNHAKGLTTHTRESAPPKPIPILERVQAGFNAQHTPKKKVPTEVHKEHITIIQLRQKSASGLLHQFLVRRHVVLAAKPYRGSAPVGIRRWQPTRLRVLGRCCIKQPCNARETMGGTSGGYTKHFDKGGMWRYAAR